MPLFLLALTCLMFYVELAEEHRTELGAQADLGDVWLCRSLCQDTDGCTDFSYNEESGGECAVFARRARHEDAAVSAEAPDKISGRVEECG